MVHRSRLALVVVLAVGVVGSGLLQALLSRAGYPALGTGVFVVGYATAALVVWAGWLRPLHLTGPMASTDTDEEKEG